MTKATTLVQRGSLALLAAVAAVPAMIACGGSSSGSAGAAAPSASAYGAYGQPGYPQQPGAYPQQPGAYPQQPGYPQQPPAGYPQQPAAPGAYPQQPGAPAAPGYPQQPGAAPAGSAPAPLGSIVTTDPNQIAQLIAQAAQAGGAILQTPGAVPGDPVQIGLQAAAALHAKGMQPEGQTATGQLQEGQHLAFTVPMSPGKCYTLIGFSPTIKNLDLNLLAPPFYNVLAGQDTTDNNTPVIGGGSKPMCPIIPLQMTYKVDVSARSGSGNVGVQLYSKAAK
jgi:hypothetical protein